MDLKNRVQQELNSAIKEKKELEVLVLRQLLAAVLNKEKEKRFRLSKGESGQDIEKESRLTDEEVIEVVSFEVKKRREAIEGFEKGGRSESAAKEKKELEILQRYLPEQLSEEEVKKIVKEAIDKTGAKEIKDMGRVMAELMSKVKGRAEGGLVSKIVKESLS